MEKIAFDLETTGIDLANDRIVQIAILIFNDKWQVIHEKCKLINPLIPISSDAMSIHGITDYMVKNAPPFAKIAKALALLFSGREIVGYNVLQFDLPILLAEFERCGVDPNFSSKIIDVYKIESNLYPRNLSAIYKKYTGYDLEDAHDALADVKATVAVLQHQLPLIKEHDVYTLSESKNLLDYTGKLAYNSAGDITFNFGKYKGKTFSEVKKEDAKYFDWVLKSDFSNQVKNIIKQYK